MVNEQSASFDDISHNVNTVTSDLDESIKSLEKVRNSSMHLDDLSQEQQEILSEFKTLDVAVDSSSSNNSMLNVDNKEQATTNVSYTNDEQYVVSNEYQSQEQKASVSYGEDAHTQVPSVLTSRLNNDYGSTDIMHAANDENTVTDHQKLN